MGVLWLPQSWDRILGLGNLCRTPVAQRRKSLWEYLVQSSGFTSEEKTQGREAKWLASNFTVVEGEIVG